MGWFSKLIWAKIGSNLKRNWKKSVLVKIWPKIVPTWFLNWWPAGQPETPSFPGLDHSDWNRSRIGKHFCSGGMGGGGMWEFAPPPALPPLPPSPTQKEKMVKISHFWQICGYFPPGSETHYAPQKNSGAWHFDFGSVFFRVSDISFQEFWG